MRRAQYGDRVGNAAHPQSALTPVASCETFSPRRNYATKPLDVKDVLHQIDWFKSQSMVKAGVDARSIIDTRYVVPLPDR
jgi:hypothetical protein